MRNKGQRWAVVLAAGEGTRLRALTGAGSGAAVPKQFCSIRGGPSLLEMAIERAARVVSRERIVVVVAADHRGWWERDLRQLPGDNVVVQPCNRGTAAGILLPLLAIAERDDEARVVVLPSDHFVAEEEILSAALERGFEGAERSASTVTLLGITPDSADAGYGWIAPGAATGTGFFRIEAFVEKPEPRVAEELLARGGVWNSFLFVAPIRALLQRYLRSAPDLLASLAHAWREGEESDRSVPSQALVSTYASLESLDFSRHLLQGSERDLRLLPVPECRWSDLGTPARVAECLDTRLPVNARALHAEPASLFPRVNLAAALGRLAAQTA